MALTDAVVRQAKTTGKAYTLNDTDGLVLFVTGKGAKKWHFRFTWMSKQQRVAIGSYPEMSLKEAREQRDDLRAQVARGVDPRIHRLQVKAAELAAPLNTFATVFKTWRDFKALSLKTGRQSTLSQIDRIFAKDVLPWLGKLSIFDIDNPHLLDVLRRIERRKAFTTAEKVRTWLNQLFRYAMVEKGLRYNPASDLDIVAAPRPPVSHNPFLRMEELPALLQALRGYGGQALTKMGLRLLLLTGVRTGELRQAVPEQFDLERGLWIIPPVIVKQLQPAAPRGQDHPALHRALARTGHHNRARAAGRACPSPGAALSAAQSQPSQGAHQREHPEWGAKAHGLQKPADRAWYPGDDFHRPQRAGLPEGVDRGATVACRSQQDPRGLQPCGLRRAASDDDAGVG